MAFQTPLKAPSRGKNSKDNRAQSYQPLSDRRKRQQQFQYEQQQQEIINNSRSKPMAISKKKSTNIFRRSKKPPKASIANSQPMAHKDKNNAFKIQQQMAGNNNNYNNNMNKKGYQKYSRSRNNNLSRDKAMTSADLLLKDEATKQQNGLAMLEHNWNNRKPYANKRNQLKSLSRKLPKTEFKLLLDEQQMTKCYDPVKLYELNKELMVKNIGTCRVEGNLSSHIL